MYATYHLLYVYIFVFGTFGLQSAYALIPSNPLGKMIYYRGLLSTFVNKITFEIADDGVILSQLQNNNILHTQHTHHTVEYLYISCSIAAYIAYKYIQNYNLNNINSNKLGSFVQYKIAQRHAKAFVIFVVLLVIKNIEPAI